MLFDVDFPPSVGLTEMATNATKYEAVAQAVAEGHAIVVPGLETQDQGEVGLVRGDKLVALEMLGAKGVLSSFQVGVGLGVCVEGRWGRLGGCWGGRDGLWCRVYSADQPAATLPNNEPPHPPTPSSGTAGPWATGHPQPAVGRRRLTLRRGVRAGAHGSSD